MQADLAQGGGLNAERALVAKTGLIDNGCRESLAQLVGHFFGCHMFSSNSFF